MWQVRLRLVFTFLSLWVAGLLVVPQAGAQKGKTEKPKLKTRSELAETATKLLKEIPEKNEKYQHLPKGSIERFRQLLQQASGAKKLSDKEIVRLGKLAAESRQKMEASVRALAKQLELKGQKQRAQAIFGCLGNCSTNYYRCVTAHADPLGSYICAIAAEGCCWRCLLREFVP